MAGEGTWRPFIDEIVLKGARAYALRMLAIKAEHQVKTDIASARTRLGSIAAIHTLCDAALDKVTTYAADANSALDKVDTWLTTDADSALDNVATQASAAVTAITNAITELGKVNTDLTNAEGVWTSEAHHLTTDDATVDKNAQDYLEDGDDKIDTVNTGDRAAEMYHTYAQREVEIATLWDQKRKDYIAAAGQHVNTMNGYFQEATSRLDTARAYIEEAGARTDAARAFIEEANSRLGMCMEFCREAEGRIAEMNTFITEAEQYMGAGDRELALAVQYREDSRDAMTDFITVLQDRAQYRTNILSTAVRQPR